MLVTDYQVLMNTGVWTEASDGWVPAGRLEPYEIARAVAFGHEADGTPLLVARARLYGGMHRGKGRLGFGGANIGYSGQEIAGVNAYEVLIQM